VVRSTGGWTNRRKADLVSDRTRRLRRAGHALAASLLIVLTAPFATASDANIDTYLQLLRSDIRSQKTKILAEGMDLSEPESKAFWPVYREYELELAKIGDERAQLFKDYAAAFHSMTDEKAEEIMRRSFALDRRQTELRERFFDRFEKATSARTAARFYQIESQVDALVYIRVAAEIPFFPKPGNGAAPSPDPLPGSAR
jgi:phosphate uptake regulator